MFKNHNQFNLMLDEQLRFQLPLAKLASFHLAPEQQRSVCFILGDQHCQVPINKEGVGRLAKKDAIKEQLGPYNALLLTIHQGTLVVKNSEQLLQQDIKHLASQYGAHCPRSNYLATTAQIAWAFMQKADMNVQKLNQLMYLTYAYHLIKYHGERPTLPQRHSQLFNAQFVATVNGPRCTAYDFTGIERAGISQLDPEYPNVALCFKAAMEVDYVWQLYGAFNAYQLSIIIERDGVCNFAFNDSTAPATKQGIHITDININGHYQAAPFFDQDTIPPKEPPLDDSIIDIFE